MQQNNKFNIYGVLGRWEENVLAKIEKGEAPTLEEIRTLALIGIMKRVNSITYAMKGDGASKPDSPPTMGALPF